MGSSYNLIEGKDAIVEIHEASGKFTLFVDDGDKIISVKGLTPDQLGELAVKLIHIGSYFAGEGDQEFMDKYTEKARRY